MYSFVDMPDYERNYDKELSSLLCCAIKYLKGDTAKVILYNDDKSHVFTEIDVDSNAGSEIKEIETIINISEDISSIFNLLLKRRQIVICSYLEESSNNEEYKPLKIGVKKEIYIPLSDPNTIDDNIIGCLYFGSYSQEGIAELNGDNRDDELCSYIHKINEIIYLKYMNKSSKRNLLRIIHILDNVAVIKDPFMANHHYNVANLAGEIARELGFSSKRMFKLNIAALFHDIGKLYITDSILNKDSKLTDSEYNEVKKHSEYSYYISKRLIPYSDNIPEIIKYHHERYDGSGYPKGLKGGLIPIESRIIAICDAVDTMISYRPYKNPMPLDDVIREVEKNRCRQFDPIISDIVIKILNKGKINSHMLLNQPIILGAVNIVNDEETLIVKGNLIKEAEGYVFKAYENYDLSAVELTKIKSMYFFTEYNLKIVEYKVVPVNIKDNSIFIDGLVMMLSNDYFSILWDLEGELEAEGKNIKVNIAKISGDSLMFFMKNRLITNNIEGSVYKFKIIFEDGEKIHVTGKLKMDFDMGYKNYYSLRYMNLSDSLRDRIIRQIFKRQYEKKQVQ